MDKCNSGVDVCFVDYRQMESASEKLDLVTAAWNVLKCSAEKHSAITFFFLFTAELAMLCVCVSTRCKPDMAEGLEWFPAAS